jgi:hypothetical protein
MSRAHAASVGCAYCVGFSGELSSDPPSSRLMETALYYTLSTIAQTLAGALAILVAVVLFKLSALAKEHEASADILNQHSVDADVYLPMARTHGYDAMAARVQEVMGWAITHRQQLRRACAAATAAFNTWGRINSRPYAALGTSVVDIAACFIGLPFTPRLASSPWAPCLLVFTVGLGIVCLLLYVWLIVAIVRKAAG